MAAEDKLQNVKAIEQMIAGTHKSQTRKTHGFSDADSTAERNKKHDVGDVWIEVDSKTGTKWKVEQKKGFRTRKPANSVRDQIKNLLTMPDECPCCKKPMKGEEEEKLNMKMYFKLKKCFSCVVSEETLIRAKGKEAWEEYSRKKMKANAEAWFKDADKEVAMLREALKMQFVQNADGKLEDWDMTSFLEKFDTDYKELKSRVFENVGLENG